MAHVRYGSEEACDNPWYIVTDDDSNLLGRDWLSHLRLDWQQINILYSNALQLILQRHQDIFKDGLGSLQDYKANIHIILGVAPQFHMACSLLYSVLLWLEK